MNLLFFWLFISLQSILIFAIYGFLKKEYLCSNFTDGRTEAQRIDVAYLRSQGKKSGSWTPSLMWLEAVTWNLWPQHKMEKVQGHPRVVSF